MSELQEQSVKMMRFAQANFEKTMSSFDTKILDVIIADFQKMEQNILTTSNVKFEQEYNGSPTMQLQIIVISDIEQKEMIKVIKIIQNMDSVQIRSTIPLICDPQMTSQKCPHSPQSVLVQANFQDLFDDNWNPRKYSYNQEKCESPKEQTNPTHRENYIKLKRNQSLKNSLKIDFQNEEHNHQNLNVNSEIDLHYFQKKHNLVIDTDKSNNQSRQQRNSNSPSKSILKFRALGNLVLSVHRLQQNVVEQIQSVEQLSVKLLQTPNNQASTSIAKVHPLYVSNPVNLNDLLNNVKLTDRFIYHAQRGSGYDIKQMIKLLQLDPKRHTRSPKDPTHLLNCMNTLGQNSMYLAAKNGNLGVLKFLVEAEANPHIKSRVYDHEVESPLQVCVRWNHFHCTKLLLDNIQFSTTEIKEALQQTKNLQMRNLLKSHLSSFFCCFD